MKKIKEIIKELLKNVDKGMMWIGPVAVLAFVIILTVMYGWVGDVGTGAPGGETIEMPEMNLVNQVPRTGQQGRAAGTPRQISRGPRQQPDAADQQAYLPGRNRQRADAAHKQVCISGRRG